MISRGKPALAIAYQSLDETFVILRADGSVERWRDGDESGWTGTGLRDSRFQTLLQLGPRVLGLSRGGTVYELDDSLHKVTGDWSVSSGARWSAMGADPDGALLAVGDQAWPAPVVVGRRSHADRSRGPRARGRCQRRRGSGRRPTRGLARRGRQPVEDLDGHTDRAATVGYVRLGRAAARRLRTSPTIERSRSASGTARCSCSMRTRSRSAPTSVRTEPSRCTRRRSRRSSRS